MSLELRRRIFDQLDSLVIIDPHTHINPLDPASHTLADILGYHYYTELAHSAGLPQGTIEDATLSPKEKVELLINNLGAISNTVQWSWFVEMAQKLFGFQGDTIDGSNWEQLYDDAERQMSYYSWADKVLETSKLSAVFLTNEFDDPLEDFDTKKYIPCLRTDDLVFKLSQYNVRERLERMSGIRATTPEALRQAIGTLFDHFVSKGARACAISLPPDFAPQKISANRALSALEAIEQSGAECHDTHKKAISNFVFWTLCEYCQEFGLPFDLMIGVNRSVYPAGVHQGRDLYDSRVSLHQYKEAFNAFPNVKFPLSVLASVTNQELTSYAWIFPNVITSGHWWYSNTPTFIEHDLAARLEAVPRTKQIGYYSDAYKLEFALPKFAMYKRSLAKVLAEKFVQDRGWSEEQAVALGTQVLQGNTEAIFPEIPLDKVMMRREKTHDSYAASVAAGGFPEEHDTFDSVAGPKLGELPSAGGIGLPIGGALAAGALGAAAAPLAAGSFEHRYEPADYTESAELEPAELEAPSYTEPLSASVPAFESSPPAADDQLDLDEMSLDPEWKHESTPLELSSPTIDTPEEELLVAFDEEEPIATSLVEDEPIVAGEIIEDAEELVSTAEVTPLEGDSQLRLDEPQPTHASDFAARATVPFDPNMWADAAEEVPVEEIAAEEIAVEEIPVEEVAGEEIISEEIPVAEVFEEDAATPVAGDEPIATKLVDDDFDDILEALDLEPENPADLKPPATDDPPEAEPDDPFNFLKK